MPTLRDVAQQAGVSLGSASSAFSGARAVSPEIRRRVWSAARSLDYDWQPRRTARPLQVTILGGPATMEDLAALPYYGPIAQALIVRLSENTRAMEVLYRSFHPAAAVQARRPGWRVAATPRGGARPRKTTIVVGPPPESALRSLCVRLAARMHTVVVDEDFVHPALDAVLTDDISAMRTAISHFAGQGHRALALVRGPQGYSSFRTRWTGFVEGLRWAGLPRNNAWVVEAPATLAGGAQAAEILLAERPHGYTLVFAANDIQALGVVEGFTRRGIRVPEDIGVVGYDDTPEAGENGLTSMQVPCDLMGELAALLALRAMPGGRGGPGRSVSVVPILVERKTTAASPGGGTRRPRTSPQTPRAAAPRGPLS